MPTKETRHKRTIAEELHEQWRKMVRIGDSAKLAELLNCSKPTIEKALIYGCVHKDEIVNGITAYFTDRITKEKKTATRLQKMAEPLNPTQNEQQPSEPQY
jgi:hypothetical protein